MSAERSDIELLQVRMADFQATVGYALESLPAVLGYVHGDESRAPYRVILNRVTNTLRNWQERCKSVHQTFIGSHHGLVTNPMLQQVAVRGARELLSAIPSELQTLLPNEINEVDQTTQAMLKAMVDQLTDSVGETNLRLHQREELKKQALKKVLVGLQQLCVDGGITLPSGFICYAWGDLVDARKVHRIADDVSTAGIKLKLDVWDNKANSIALFTRWIKEQDYVMVMGSPILVEKWENYKSGGRSRQEDDGKYVGHVVAQELRQIEARINSRPCDQHGIVTCLISGDHAHSLPDFLQDLASDERNFLYTHHYVESLFALLAILRPASEADQEAWQRHIDTAKSGVTAEFKRIDALLEENVPTTKLKGKAAQQEHAFEATPFSRYSLKVAPGITKDSSSHIALPGLQRGREYYQTFTYNVTKPDRYFTGREEELARVRKLLWEEGNVVISQLAVCGYGGIGKSQLAKHYVETYRNEYDFVAWLGAELSFRESLNEMARHIKLSYSRNAVPLPPDGDISLDTIVDLVSQFERWLVVIDNVESEKGIANFMEKPFGGNGHILLTSRQAEFHQCEIMLLDALGETDSVELLRKIIKNNHSDIACPFTAEEQVSAMRLAKQMNFYPLALSQAGALIKQHFSSIDDYSDRYESDRRSLLNRRGTDPNYPETVLTIWQQQKRIILQEQDGRQILLLLQLCTLLDPDSISTDFLNDLLIFLERKKFFQKYILKYLPVRRQTSFKKLLFSMRLFLMRYCIVDSIGKSELWSIHRVVSGVIFDDMEMSQRAEIFDQVASFLTEPFDLDNYPEYSSQARERNFPHIMRLHSMREGASFGDGQLALDLETCVVSHYRYIEESFGEKKYYQRGNRLCCIEADKTPLFISQIAIAIRMLFLAYLIVITVVGLPAMVVFLIGMALLFCLVPLSSILGNNSIVIGILAQIILYPTMVAGVLAIPFEYTVFFGLIFGFIFSAACGGFANFLVSIIDNHPIRKKIALFEKHLLSEKDFMKLAALRIDLSELYLRRLGDHLDSQQFHLQEALTLLEEKYGHDAPELVSTLTRLGSIAIHLDNFSDARLHFERAREIQVKEYGLSHWRVALNSFYMAKALEAMNNSQAALVQYRFVVQHLPESFQSILKIAKAKIVRCTEEDAEENDTGANESTPLLQSSIGNSEQYQTLFAPNNDEGPSGAYNYSHAAFSAK